MLEPLGNLSSFAQESFVALSARETHGHANSIGKKTDYLRFGDRSELTVIDLSWSFILQ
jgi:hypothetical protein